jgi:farnesyl-diphosphate farnesyltransferase
MPRSLSPELAILLKQTSRTFHKTLWILPASIRFQIGLAYLLARTTDTIADSEIIPVEQRLRALQQLRERVLGQRNTFLDCSEIAGRQGDPAEKLLLEKCDLSLAQLRDLSSDDLQRVREVLTTIISGQELDLQRFANVSFESGITALQNEAELDDYTYRVAGCVGEFWTKMCRAHLFPKVKLDEARLFSDAVRFGKGLQLVNILRDLPVDLRKGRCYLPVDQLAQNDLHPADLLQAMNQSKFGSVYQRYLDFAEAHLVAGWNYTNTIPRGQVRVRLACAWPILIGMETLRRLRTGNILDASQRIKINRADVRRIIFQSVVRYPLADSWRRLGPASA